MGSPVVVGFGFPQILVGGYSTACFYTSLIKVTRLAIVSGWSDGATRRQGFFEQRAQALANCTANSVCSDLGGWLRPRHMPPDLTYVRIKMIQRYTHAHDLTLHTWPRNISNNRRHTQVVKRLAQTLANFTATRICSDLGGWSRPRHMPPDLTYVQIRNHPSSAESAQSVSPRKQV